MTSQLTESCPVIGLKVPETEQKQGKKIEDSINGRILINKYIHKQDGKKGIESQTHVKPKPMVKLYNLTVYLSFRLTV